MTTPLHPGHPGTVAVVGLGRLGSVLADRLAERFTVLLHDADPKVARQVAADLSLPDMEPRELLAAADTVLLCVPPQDTARALRRLAALAGQLGRRPLFVNLATSVPTHELPEVGLEVVGLKPVCQFTAVALGLKTVLVTSAPRRITLLRTLAADLGEVVLGPEEVVGPANRAATKAALRACADLATELTGRGLPAEMVQAAIRNVLVGTALDYPPADTNPYTRSVLDELAAEAAAPEPQPAAALGWAAWAERPATPGGPA
ncbi:NAD(P)-binding domain-containing protein [Kitasatospora aureofaciens]|uniref:NAD(P)-binding domain-containing protein n=1 Tax=Kitasatospora aureofaciens TaxID=1894 RepID=UPI001C49511E|nr:NAD(P)-binding domain-containing protein [Kitasatospora aureofaciens]MBV6702051.1 NAD(P)-binding domain-containing protein [Kitasatospora aureofaciens]